MKIFTYSNFASRKYGFQYVYLFSNPFYFSLQEPQHRQHLFKPWYGNFLKNQKMYYFEIDLSFPCQRSRIKNNYFSIFRSKTPEFHTPRFCRRIQDIHIFKQNPSENRPKICKKFTDFSEL